jgi:hypothetical protein
MRNWIVAAGAAVVLTACGGDSNADADGDGTVSAEEMRAEVASEGGGMKPEPGKYKVTMDLTKADIPGAPPEMKDMMGSMMSNSFEYCLTPEEAEKGYEEALTEGQDESCTVQKFDLDGGNIDMAMTCANPDEGTMSVAMTGNVSSTRSEINVVSKGNISGMGDANIEMSMIQERLGDCDS